MFEATNWVKPGSVWLNKMIWGWGILSALLFLCLISTGHDAFVNAPPESLKIPARNGNVAGGIKIADYIDGQKNFSVKIDELRVEKKKMGFLALGFMKIACLDGVEIDWYETMSSQADDSKETQFDLSKKMGLNRILEKVNRLREHLPGHIKGIELNRVKINFFRDGKLLSVVTADQARIKKLKKLFVLKGNVKIESSGIRILACNEIAWKPGTKKLTASGSYKLEKDGQIFHGKGLETDFELADIIFHTRNKG